MTEGNGHVIDPAGDARRVLQAVVAEQGPEALSNAVIMDGVCQARLSNLPGEAILIGSAARADVPALLRDLIPRLGNYGAIQSVATTLAEAHGLDSAACVWVVREFARALGLIASGGTHPAARVGPVVAPVRAPRLRLDQAGRRRLDKPGRRPGLPRRCRPGQAGRRPPGRAGQAARECQAGLGDLGVLLKCRGGAGGAGERPSSGTRLLSRNTVGIAAAIALVAGYLGVAAAAQLSPFPAKTVVATSSAPANRETTVLARMGHRIRLRTRSTSTSDYQVLLSKIPNVVQGTNNCHNDGIGRRDRSERVHWPAGRGRLGHLLLPVFRLGRALQRVQHLSHERAVQQAVRVHDQQ